MGRDALNFFSPFSRLEPNHENQLTRALLVTLRVSPIAHAAWLRFFAPGREIYQLPPADYDTQRRAVRQAGEADEPADLISVFLTPEASLTGDRVVTESDRGQVLDAVINYGGELLVVVENKVAEADSRQARELNVTGAKVRIGDDQEAVTVLWRDLLEAFVALRERNLVGGAEEAVLDDFLTYVEDHFPGLGPFRILSLAHGNQFRQTKRLRQLLGEAIGLEALLDPHGPYVSTPDGSLIGKNVYLRVKDDSAIELIFYPADTLTQAWVFYQDPRGVTGLRDLRAGGGWYAGPNFHFGYMQRGFCWTCNRTCGALRGQVRAALNAALTAFGEPPVAAW
jgi:hypothetical protein